MKILLNIEQEKVYNEVINTNNNFYITGGAGTGKSVLLKEIVKKLNENNLNVAITAPTGIASLNVDGRTLHSFFHLDPHSLKDSNTDEKTEGRIKVLDVLIIDEISMVRCDLFDHLNDLTQKIKHNSLFFGGIKVIIFGDLYQLPPITDDTVAIVGRRQLNLLKTTYGKVENNEYFFFYAECFNKFKQTFLFRELNINERQKNDGSDYLSLLNKIRTGDNLLNSDFLILNKCVNEIPEDIISITATRNKSSSINKSKLDSINMPLFESTGIIHKKYLYNDISDGLPDLNLQFKKGSKIIMTINDPVNGWVNGTFGKITDVILSQDKNILSVKADINTKEGIKSVSILRNKWKIKIYEAQNSRLNTVYQDVYEQFPFRLGWAITIHKSQGQTYEKVFVSINDGWLQHGLYYVALSRCKTLEGLYLDAKVDKSNIFHSREVAKFMRDYFYFNKEEDGTNLTLEDEYIIYRMIDEYGIDKYSVKSSDNFSSSLSADYQRGSKFMYFLDKNKDQVDINFFDKNNIEASYKNKDLKCKVNISDLSKELALELKNQLEEDETLDKKCLIIKVFRIDK